MKRMIITAASRFQREIAGDFGDYWKRDALSKVDEYTKHADEAAIVEDDGAIRWKKNGNYLPDDYCEVLEYGRYPFSREATRIKREEQQAENLAQYRERMKNYVPSEEELYEMRSAFGEGTTVVDALTGQKYNI